jgi:hypothetical protein
VKLLERLVRLHSKWINDDKCSALAKLPTKVAAPENQVASQVLQLISS